MRHLSRTRAFSEMKTSENLLLPNIETGEDYRRVYRHVKTWLPAMRLICERHGLDAAQLEFAPPGTHVVFRVGPDWHIKLFAPLWPDDFLAELTVLQKLSGRVDLPIPHLVANGEIEDWPYLILTTVEGVPLCEAWHLLSRADREHIAVCCGEFMASLHSVPTEGLEPIGRDWPVFVENQIRHCIDLIHRMDLSPAWTKSVLEFLDDLPPLYEPGFQPVLLSADITDEHLLVRECGGRWQLTGFIDFGDAMLGHPHYDFVAPGCSVTRGSPALLRAMLLAYGYTEDQLNATLTDQLMAYTLIHRFVTIPDLLELFDSERPGSFEELKRRLWSFSEVI